MESNERPNLPLAVYQAIESAQIRIDAYYWKRLLSLQVPLSASTVVHFSYPDLLPTPPKPQRPDALRSVITRYVRNLFVVEAARYPISDNLEYFLRRLGERTTDHVMDAVASLEAAGDSMFRKAHLGHHGLSNDELRNAAMREINALIDGRLEQVQPPMSPIGAAADKAAHLDARSALESHSEVERRAKLLADYKRATGNPSNKSIYSSSNSGIYKPEFYQWRDGRLSAKSKMTKKFESFLKAKRRPIPRKPTIGG